MLCFDYWHPESCYSFDGKINYIGDSNSRHFLGGLARYKKNLVTYGCDKTTLEDFEEFSNLNETARYRRDNSKSSSLYLSEIMKMTKNGTFIWSDVVGVPLFNVDSLEIHYPLILFLHSLVNVPSDINEEYVLLIGGAYEIKKELIRMQAVFKFTGSWSYFGKLNKARSGHNAIYWNGAVYVFGGEYSIEDGHDFRKTKMEIWKIEDSPDEFKTSENWPELDQWMFPHLFIVPDSFFPDK